MMEMQDEVENLREAAAKNQGYIREIEVQEADTANDNHKLRLKARIDAKDMRVIQSEKEVIQSEKEVIQSEKEVIQSEKEVI
jgi:ribosomal protein S8